MDGLRCPVCDACVSRREAADGWCESCGKKLPAAFLQHAVGPMSQGPHSGLAKGISWLRLLVAGVIAALYGWSLYLDVFIFGTAHTTLPGLGVLLFGWAGLLFGSIESIAWYANPPFVVGLILFAIGKSRAAPWLALAALLLALPSFWIQRLPEAVLKSRPGARSIESFGLGFYAWVGSLVVLAAVAWLFRPPSCRSVGGE